MTDWKERAERAEAELARLRKDVEFYRNFAAEVLAVVPGEPCPGTDARERRKVARLRACGFRASAYVWGRGANRVAGGRGGVGDGDSGPRARGEFLELADVLELPGAAAR